MEMMLIIAGIIAITMMWSFYTGDVPKPYRLRSCTGKNWKRKFPSVQKEEIREFLNLFTDSFAFAQSKGLSFDPDDKVLDIYEALYPSKWMGDALEVETLADDLEREYGIVFSDVWHDDLTLGELFRKARRA